MKLVNVMRKIWQRKEDPVKRLPLEGNLTSNNLTVFDIGLKIIFRHYITKVRNFFFALQHKLQFSISMWPYLRCHVCHQNTFITFS